MLLKNKTEMNRTQKEPNNTVNSQLSLEVLEVLTVKDAGLT